MNDGWADLLFSQTLAKNVLKLKSPTSTSIQLNESQNHNIYVRHQSNTSYDP